MRYHSREIDAVAFWSRYVDFPNMKIEEEDVFAPKVVCPNPSHDTLKHHFQVNLIEPLVHCFAHCGISGSWEHAICVIEGLYEKFHVEEAQNKREEHRRTERAHREARKLILKHAKVGKFSQRTRISHKGSSLAKKVVRSDELAYESYLPQVALDYLATRGVSDDSVAAWNLGWLPKDKRLVIPARDEIGRIRFLVKRAVIPGQNPKYLYTEGFPKTSLLFGACQIDLGMVRSKGLILVEGSLDTIMLHQHGLRNTAGILGTGISDLQCRIIDKLRPSRIVLAFDKDTAGIHNIEIAAGKLRKYPLYVMRYPRAKSDPAELTQEEAYRQFQRVVPAFRFIAENGLNVKRPRRKEIQVG